MGYLQEPFFVRRDGECRLEVCHEGEEFCPGLTQVLRKVPHRQI